MARTDNGVGNVYRSLGDYEKALIHYSNTPYNNMGAVYIEQGRCAEALEAYSKSLDIKVKVLGDNCPLVADTKENIGLVLKTTDKASEAKALFEEAASIRRLVFGSSHAKTKKSEELAAECT